MTTPKTTRATTTIRTVQDIEALEQQVYETLIPSRNLYEVLAANAALHGDRPALTVLRSADPGEPAATRTHTQLLADVTRAANLFSRLGAERGTVISLLSRTHPEIPALIWGAEVAGVANCINYLLSADVIATLLNAEKAEILVCSGPDLDTEIWKKVQAVVAATPSLRTVLVIGEVPETLDRSVYRSFAEEWQRVDGDSLQFALPGPDDRAALFHTGGTTGVPKLVPQTHRNQIHAAWCLSQAFDLSETDVGLNGFPLFHVGGTSTVGLSVLAAAGHLVMLSPDGFRNPGIVKNIWALVEHYGATVMGGVPTTIGAIADVPVAGRDLSTLRFVLTGGASLTRSDARRFEQCAGVPLLEQYGMTETVAAIAATPLHGAHVRGSVGLRGPFSVLKVRPLGQENEHVDCPPGEIGSVLVKGAQVVAGYLDPAHTREAFTDDGFLVTGDVGYLDDNQYLHLTGREKDLIIRSGHNIDPLAIEEVANAHPDVLVSAAVGMPDDYAGEVPVIFLAVSDPEHFDLASFHQYMKDHVHEPPAKPKHVFVLDEIPVTGVGKIFKPKLRELAAEHQQRLAAQPSNR